MKVILNMKFILKLKQHRRGKMIMSTTTKRKKKRKHFSKLFVPFAVVLVLFIYILTAPRPIGKSISNNIEKTKAKIEEPEIKNTSNDSTNVVDTKVVVNTFSLKGTTYTDSRNKVFVKNTDSILILVNKTRNLQFDYIPNDLTIPDVKFSFTENSPRKQLRKDAADALEELFQAAENENIQLLAASGYRSYEKQKSIFERKVDSVGKIEAAKYVAFPGQSEHQTGLAMDVTSKSVNYSLSANFEETEEGKWLKDNCHKYGFILRYPEDKENTTGYNYEPWHIRYVGKKVSAYIYTNNLTLEEFFSEENSNI